MKPLNLILFGPPGAGKSTQAAYLDKLAAIDSISTGQRLRQTVETGSELGQEVAQVMAEGRLVDDTLMNKLLNEWLLGIPSEVGVLLDGYPRTLSQAQSLDQLMQTISRPLDVVIALTLSDEEAIRRLSGRRICRIKGQPDQILHINDQAALDDCRANGGMLIERDDDKPETIKRRLAEYNAKTEPLLQFYGERDLLILIDADGTPDQVSKAIEQALQQRFNGA
ncbi:nucleoside monophosphate kinase [Herpetosiphon gulosus]|uniref:Adenylate kinase n=1 Tax=Herpetosiphon gulosus TaxID=1973496 RepID=A0ABP9X2L1_9CHLR